MNPWFMKFDTTKTDKTTKRTTIKLEDDEVALVVDSDSNFSIYLPQMDDDDVIPDHMQFMTAIAVVTTTDQEVIDLIWERFYKLMEGAH